jgi:hypothetical protein
LPKTKRVGGKDCPLDKIRVVQRFVTVVYLGGVPVRTVHWTSTSEGLPWKNAPATTATIDDFPGYKDPRKLILGWKTGHKIED